jgi:competence protein ComEC
MTVLDVGQGLAVTIETRRHTLVYDTGARYTETSDAGGRIIAPFLRAIGRPRADGLVISHQDLDHSGGALSLMQTVPVGWLASSLYANHPIVLQVLSRDRLATACVAGQTWTWDGVLFTMLHPTAAEYGDTHSKTNDRSCVVRVDSAYGSALLTGDIEARSEALLVARDPAALRTDVLLVPHHGSRTSSTVPFVRAVGAMFAVVGAGYLNRFGHPRRDVVARYTVEGARVLRTDEWGAVAFTFATTENLAPQLARVDRQRYWLALPGATAGRAPD